jgi:serine/threonine protein kinase
MPAAMDTGDAMMHSPCRRKSGQCMQLRLADQQYITLSDLGTTDKPHENDCTELSLVVAGRPSSKRFALKSAHDDTAHARESFKNEKRALELCGTWPFVPSLHRSDERTLCLVQELASFDLSRIATGGLPLSWVRWVAASMVLALEHVHSHRVLHLDIKMDNILLSREGTPQLADFGCAVHLETLDSRVALSSFRGTPRFGAPEMLEELENGSCIFTSNLPLLVILCPF